MFRPTRPSHAVIEAHLRALPRAFSHPHEGATRGGADAARALVGASYDVDHYRVVLGSGDAVFERARAALSRWAQFDLGWVELCFPSIPIEVGAVVGVLARPFGIWSLNACRIAYCIDESDRFGFGYGTLSDHAESGEERFLIERAADGGVGYEILAFSRPAALAARIGRPFARRLQARFAAESLRRMQREIAP